MERKAIQLAGKTLVVSLPSKWAKRYGIKKGDSLVVEERDRSLLVSTIKGIEVEKVQLALKGPYEFIKRSIDVAYKKGVNELSLSFEKPEIRKKIEEVLDTTMGFEIISQGEKSCLIKSVATAVEEEFDNILRRVFLTLLSMAEESYNAVSKSQFLRLSEISASDKTINKLTNFCKRILNKKGYKDYKLTNYIYCIVWELERIADEYRDICIQLRDSKKAKINKEVLQLYKETNEFLRDFYNLFYKFDQEKGIGFTNKRKVLLEKCRKLILKKHGAEAVLVHHLTNIITATYDIAGPYYAMKL